MATATKAPNGKAKVIPEIGEAIERTRVTISPPNIQIGEFHIEGTAPFVQNRFSKKAMEQMREKMLLGQQAKKGKARQPRNFDADYQSALYKSTEGWYGIPASSFRNGAISVCRLVNFKMTLAKMSIFVLADGLDFTDGTPLIRIEGGEPERVEHCVRNATGVADIRVRGMWKTWKARVRVQYDADQFSATDVMNLMMRIGSQCGIGEGRPDSPDSAGMGWGTFKVLS